MLCVPALLMDNTVLQAVEVTGLPHTMNALVDVCPASVAVAHLLHANVIVSAAAGQVRGCIGCSCIDCSLLCGEQAWWLLTCCVQCAAVCCSWPSL
jgi:hypothetical protein